ncbi:kinase-like protein [Rhizophagus irregularis]|uniref:Kinase-like protein n=1 Tax=Rhizophagus irregularis TaxID=588596 RepID=A0A2N0NZB9_9GLOM|nr:kinase-like protein [Rhizophagus irregularis]
MTRNPLTRYPDCHKEWMSLRWCRGCNPKHFESERHKWTSGNSEIDDFILETQITAEFSDQALEWIPETQLTEFKLIGKGGFGKEGRAYNVEKGEEGVKEFLEEIKAMHQCRKVNLGSLDRYGVTRHPDTKKISNDRLWSLTIDFRSLHRSGLVHRDLHSGNVLFGDNRRNFVADLGLACKDGQNITGEIKGFWYHHVLTSPQPPLYETAYDSNLALSICDGKRPQVIKGTPACYVELMKKCWDPDPSKRPTAQEMAEIFNKWTQIFSKDELNEEEKSIKDQFVSSDLERLKSSRPTRIFRELSTRPLTSRLLPTVSLSNQDLLNLSYNVFIQHAEYQTTQYDLKITNDLPATKSNKKSKTKNTHKRKAASISTTKEKRIHHDQVASEVMVGMVSNEVQVEILESLSTNPTNKGNESLSSIELEERKFIRTSN